MLRQISLVWSDIKNNRRTIGLLSLDNWRGVNLWRNKNELSTLADCRATISSVQFSLSVDMKSELVSERKLQQKDDIDVKDPTI